MLKGFIVRRSIDDPITIVNAERSFWHDSGLKVRSESTIVALAESTWFGIRIIAKVGNRIDRVFRFFAFGRPNRSGCARRSHATVGGGG